MTEKEINDAWKEHFELCNKRDAMKKNKKTDPYAYKKVKRELLPNTMHDLLVQFNCIEEYTRRVCRNYEDLTNLLDDAVYVVDYGNIDKPRNRQTFPQDFEGAKQYFDYIKEHWDWAEILMSVNIHYNERYIEARRARRAN